MNRYVEFPPIVMAALKSRHDEALFSLGYAFVGFYKDENRISFRNKLIDEKYDIDRIYIVRGETVSQKYDPETGHKIEVYDDVHYMYFFDIGNGYHTPVGVLWKGKFVEV